MAAPIDDKVVAMSFESAKFEQGIANTIKALEELKKSLQFPNAGKGLDDLSKAASRLDFSNISKGVDRSVTTANHSLQGLNKNLQLPGASRGLDELGRTASKLDFSNISRGVDRSVTTANRSLEGLNRHLQLPGASRGLDDFGRAASRLDLSNISRGVDNVISKLGVLRLTGIAVLADIATKAISTGKRFASAFTLDPIKAGFSEYSTNLNAIQTILANTQAAGTTLDDVNKALLNLNKYSDQTIYNFSQMAKNIGTFTAAGVDLDTSVGAIKGIANLAALSGSSAEQAASAMYQLSQAIAAGRVGMQDWNSVNAAGIGGTVFQRALAQTAVSMGKLKESAVKLSGPMKNVTIDGINFRNTLTAKPGKQSWLTSEVLTRTLQQFTGDLSNAELAAQGFNDAQIKSIQQTAKTAKLAATEVKTIKQVFDVAKETAGSGWSQTFQIIFGNFGEAKKTFTALSNAVNGFINRSAAARNKVLGDWKALGGRTILLMSIKTAFENISKALVPIRQAFREFFPRTTVKDLIAFTTAFANFADKLEPSAQTLDNLKRTFRGVFAIFDIGVQLIKAVAGAFGNLFGTTHTGLLSTSANIGDFIVRFDEALKKGQVFAKFFSGLGKVLKVPAKIISEIASTIGKMFSGFSGKKVSGEVSATSKVFAGFKKVLQSVVDIFNKIKEVFTGHSINFQPLVDSFANMFNDLGPALGKAASNLDFEPVLAVIRTGLLAGMFLLFKSFLGKGAFTDQLGKELGRNINATTSGLVKNISGSFRALQDSLIGLQQNIKAKTLKEIAISVVLLAGSMVVLSLIDSKKLASALSAMTVAFGDLIGAMALLTAVTKSAGFIKLPLISSSLIFLAFALDLLSVAVLALSTLSWQELLKGLSGVAGLLAALVVASGPLSKNSAGMITAGIGITAMAVGLRILVTAVAAFATMSWDEIKKGLISVAIALGVIAAAVNVMPPHMAAMGVGIIAIAVGLKLLQGAVAQFAAMDTRALGKGLVSIGIGLGIIAGAMHLMPKNLAFTAAGLILVSVALGRIASIVRSMSKMSLKEIATGLGALGGALAVLAAGLYAMSGTVAAAVALGIVAASLTLLIPALLVLGHQKTRVIVKSLVTLAAAFAVIGVAGLALAPVIPALLALGVALVLIGGGLALAGTGIALIGIGLSSLAVSVPTSIGILVAAIEEIQHAIPEMVKNFIVGILQIAREIGNTAPLFIKPILKIVASIAVLIVRAIPKLLQILEALVGAGLQFIHDKAPDIIKAGLEFILNLLKGIAKNITKLAKLGADIVVGFIKGLTSKIGDIVKAGADFLVQFLKGVAQHIGKVAKAAFDVITNFITAIGANLPRVVIAAAGVVVKLIEGLTQGAQKIAKAGLDAMLAFIRGIADAEVRIVTEATKVVIKLINALSSNAVKLADAGALAIINFLNGMAGVIDKRAPELRRAGFRVGVAIMDGLTFGLASKVQAVVEKIAGIVNKVKGALGKLNPFGGGGKDKKGGEEAGKNVVEGVAKGINKNQKVATDAAGAMADAVINTTNTHFGNHSPSKVMFQIGQFVTQGFANGIRAGSDEVRNAFTDLNNMLLKTIQDSTETIATEKEKLNKLWASKNLDTDAIRKAQDVISQNEEILAKSRAGRELLIKGLQDEKTELIKLSNQYDSLSERLKEAKDNLKQAKQEQADAAKSFADQYKASPELADKATEEIKSARENIASEQSKLNDLLANDPTNVDAITQQQNAIIAAKAELDTLISGKALDASGNSIDQLATYMLSLTNQVKAVQTYSATLEQLRKLGIDKETYEKLVTEGTADQSFASQLLAGGKTAVQGLNKLDLQLKKASESLGTAAADRLFKAGVDSAQGLVNGLESKQQGIKNAMEDLADEMVRALKNKLKSKSPSQVFMDIGSDTMEGFAIGIGQSTQVVTKSVTSAADDAIVAMKKSMARISSIASSELNTNPVITPVLDLTTVQSQAKELAGLTNVNPITAAASYGQASIISSQQRAIATEEAAAVPPGATITFEQNNHSPEALSESEIYRQTKNGLSQLKSALGITP